MKILITQLGKIGDMILLTPMFSIIKEKFPNSLIDIICGTKNHIIIINNPHIHNIYIFDKSPLKLIDFLMKIRKNNYDYYIDPKDHFSKESSILAGLIKSPRKIGFIAERNSNFNLRIPTNKENIGIHYSKKILNPLTHLGIDINKNYYKPELFESHESIEFVNDFLKNYNLKKFILINISASQKRKMWSSQKWIDLIKKIQHSKMLSDLNFVITSAPSDAEEIKYILKNTEDIIHFKSGTILDVVSLIKKSELLITPDTAVVHISAAFNTKLLGLFANNPSFFSMFRPMSDFYEVVMTPEGSENIDDISVDKVYEAFKRILEKL